MTCHKTFTGWTPAKFHGNVSVVTGCANCHGTSAFGQTAKPNNATHTGVTQCESCHKSTSTWSGAKVDHSTFTTATNCGSCHNGGTASGKPGNHIPESALQGGATLYCMACHTSKTTWSTVKMNHNASLGNGAGWCKTCHVKGSAYLGDMEKKSLSHEAKAGTVPTDCSMSGCHRPLGNKGAAYSKWD